MRRTLLLALLCLLALPASASALVVGIGDQKPDMFADQRFAALGIKHARISIAWDTLSQPEQLKKVDAWMLAARLRGVQPLVGFGHSLQSGRRRALPSAEQFRRNFVLLRQRWPWVTDWATWNEANHCSEPVCRKPKLAARYYLAMKRACPQCRVLAAELIDSPSMIKWARDFRKAARKDLPRWGLHNYLDANRFQTKRTKQLLKAVKGEIWLTETGGLVARRNRSGTRLPGSPGHAASATRFVLRNLARLSPRIKRVYLYHWNSVSALDTWDSAFIDPLGRERPALGVLRTELRRLAR